MAKKLKVASADQNAAIKTIDNKTIHDFEDGLEYYSASSSECKCVITHDKDDFYFSEIEVLDAEEFLLKYAVKKRT